MKIDFDRGFDDRLFVLLSAIIEKCSLQVIWDPLRRQHLEIRASRGLDLGMC